MLKTTTAPRAPRGAKPVSQAFFSALETIPEATRAAVAKSAVAMIRDELKARKDKMKAAAMKEKARKAVVAKKPVKAAPVKKAVPAKAKAVATKAPVKRAAKTPAAKPVAPQPNGADLPVAAAAPKRRSRKSAETSSAV